MTDQVNDISLPSLEATGELDINELAFVKDLVANEFYYRRELLEKLKHPNRDIDEDCGYPDDSHLSAQIFLNLYQRFPIATRVIDLPVDESWRGQPSVFESEDEDKVTPFEAKWDDLGTKLRGDKSWFQDQAGNPVWEKLQRVDRLSRIGHYGILFLEFDDVGKKKNGQVITWRDPAPGFEPEKTMLSSGDLVENAKVPKELEEEPEDDEEVEDEEAVDEEGEELEEGEEGTEDEDLEEGDKPKSKYDESKPKEIDPDDIETEVELIGLRCFDEVHATVTVWDGDHTSPRYGMPVEYTLQFGEAEGARSGQSVNSVLRDVHVHWSRVIHVADGLTNSEFIGTPACRPVVNDILDLQKIFGASGEGYWRMAFPGLSFESHPQLGSKVRFDAEGTKAQLERYQNTLQRYLATTGGTVKLLSGSVGDPTPHIETRINAICIYLKCPVRIFKGSERGELASSQDKDSWDERMALRQVDHITPRIIVPFVDRLIKVGVLPEPEGFSVEWPDITQLSQEAKLRVATAYVAAMTQYISGGVDTLIDPLFFLTKILNFDAEEAKEILKAAEEHTVEKKEEQADQMQVQQAEQAAQMADAGLPMPGQGPPIPGQGVPGQPPGAVPPKGAQAPPFSPGKPKGKPGAVPPQFTKNESVTGSGDRSVVACKSLALISSLSPEDFTEDLEE